MNQTLKLILGIALDTERALNRHPNLILKPETASLLKALSVVAQKHSPDLLIGSTAHQVRLPTPNYFNNAGIIAEERAAKRRASH
jgi:hypothetical protein